MEDKGQKLEPDQKNAIKKLDSVVEMVDMLKEINKNVSDCLNDVSNHHGLANCYHLVCVV